MDLLWLVVWYNISRGAASYSLRFRLAGFGLGICCKVVGFCGVFEGAVSSFGIGLFVCFLGDGLEIWMVYGLRFFPCGSVCCLLDFGVW